MELKKCSNFCKMLKSQQMLRLDKTKRNEAVLITKHEYKPQEKDNRQLKVIKLDVLALLETEPHHTVIQPFASITWKYNQARCSDKILGSFSFVDICKLKAKQPCNLFECFACLSFYCPSS